ncbi:uncharacterized protein LOC132917458 [Rhopalosiphum padi]|uniref:uncharacterized protein LOC132917458 n=1 Tax=Rhopalosiphum padi TaxID=40932 RepID=UPI00298E39B6|nr:uncharacterized protein LOC132917458 [Rhopalosiphum padi]XP_060834190.1 uncharacterized protein LOC132917458 [Rhopalosiphum padi]
MSSSSPPVDYQKPVKVKSRWTQSCQIEMMMEESQSSLDMSDTVTDVSTSDLNDSTDYSSEFNSLELRKSRKTTNNRRNYRRSNQKKKKISSKSFNEEEQKWKQLSNTSVIGQEYNISQESNIIRRHTSVDWNNISIFQSKSVNNMTEIIDKLPSKPIRRASIPWKFKFSFTKDVKDNARLLEKDLDYLDLSNAIKYLNLNELLLSNENKLTRKENIIDNHTITAQQSYCLNMRDLNCRDFDGLSKKILNITELNEISTKNLNKFEQSDELTLSGKQYNEKDQNTNLEIPKSFFSEPENLKCNPVCKLREIRSKSCDFVLKKTYYSFKRYKSFDDLNQLKNSVIDTFKLQKPEKKSPKKKKRRQSKRIKPKNNHIEILDDMKVPEVNFNQVADEIYKEHKNQLLEARINDVEFDEKLKATNFTLVDENVYRPNRQTLKLYPPSEIPILRKLKQRVISGDINDYCECTLSKEDIMEGNIGCDDRCLNRLLKVECGLGCSLKRYCTNKQFQNKQFKKTNIIKTANKGYGICAIEDIPKGVLISEYVGEVIDYNEMCNRLTKEEYKNLNYMVQLNPDEIIDSTSKGNVTRFINHSCDPNSVGEKWHVLGQSRIGFFSTRPIKKGEEITFDYSFQIFGDGAQICYCGSSKCRGYINKSSQIVDHNSSEDSESANENVFISKPEEKKRKKKILEKRAANNNENKLRELRRQLTEIAKLKTGLKADQEMATLNLNRLMVHITDSVSRLHVLTFIREHDMNKRLFMDFSGLSIIHNWMTSNENESFKLMILEILAELPITNRNTITKSKVLDVVAEWAEIPQDVKAKIESLEYPATEIKNHCQEIDNLLPNDNGIINSLVKKSRALWKKWIVLKMVFKIPKKIDQHKPTTKINSSKLIDDRYQSSMVIPTFDRKTFRHSNKYKVRNQQTLTLDRTQLRKEYKFKVDQERQKMFRKKVMDDWYEKCEGVVNKKSNENYLQHPQNFLSCNNSTSNNNNGTSEQIKWDSSLQATHIDQNSIINYSMSNSCLNYMPPQTFQQPLIQFPQYSYIQSQALSDYHQVNQPTFFNTPPLQTSSQPLITQLQNITLSNNKPVHQDIESPNLSPTKHLIKLAETNVFNLINDSLRKHYNPDKIKVVNSEIEHSKKPCTRVVQSGADLLARIKVISNSFKNQPSKLITVKNLKHKNDNTKIEKVSLSDIKLKTVCDKNNKIVFINEKTNVTSNTLSEDVVPIPKTIKVSQENKFANAIFNSLLKKVLVPEDENSVPKTFVSKALNSDIVTYHETDKEIELYNNMKPKVLKKVVGHVKTKNGFAPVLKRQWGIQLKGLKRNRDEIPATKRNILRKGSLHRLALKNSLVNVTKSALKRQSSINVDDYLKRPKEKRVTFWIEGETSPNLSHPEVRPINLNQNTVKQKPLMKCHPFEIRNEPKSILQPSTSAIQGDDNFQIPGLDSTNDQIITPIVAKFKASRNRRISLRDKSIELDQLRSQRKHKIPISMMSLSVDVLKLIPDNRKEMKKIIDYYHSMATVIVKTLGSYAKKTCQQGRIRSNEDFKYLARKINENVLLKELQLKKVDKLKISDSTKDKVAEYIRKYMSRFGESYKKKSNEQTNHKPK